MPFALLRPEWVDRQDCESHSTAVASISKYIDYFYRSARKHSHLDYVSPIRFCRARIRQ